jgi:hypothetical protein
VHRWLEKAVRKLAPGLSSSLEAARQLPKLKQQLNALAESYSLIRQDADMLRFYSEPENRRMKARRDDMIDEAESWMIAGSGPQMQSVSIRENALVPVQVRERLWELELALEDRGWQRQLALSQTEFSRYGLQQIILMSRLYYLKNPLMQRGVNVSAHYVWARGFEVLTDDDASTEVLQDFFAQNTGELGQIAMCRNHQALYTDGNLYLTCFRDKGTGALTVRQIDATEVFDIITNSDDISEPQYYYRKWQARTFDTATGISGSEMREAYYPAADFDSPIDSINGKPVFKDQPVFHLKVGSMHSWLFGLPICYCAIDWVRAYKSFLEDWATLNRALARFAWNLETKGGQQAVEQFQKILSTTLGQGGTSVESNPPPVAGSTFVTGPGNKLEPIKTAGTTSNPEQGRRIMLMAAAAFGLPETFFGDASTGSLATAQSLDRPTELMFLYWQETWREFIQKLGMYVLNSSNTAPGGKLREARKASGKNGDLSDITITVKFPSILEHDIPQMISAIVQGVTLGGFDLAGTADMKTVAMMILAELGVEDPNAVFGAMYPNYDPKDYAKKNDEPDPNAQAHPSIVKPSFGAESARLTEAINQLKRASEKMLARTA